MSPTSSENGPENRSFDMVGMMDSLIGPNKKKHNEGTRMFGLPQPLKSREELLIEKGMESCTFKTVVSCVLGKLKEFVSLHTRTVDPLSCDRLTAKGPFSLFCRMIQSIQLLVVTLACLRLYKTLLLSQSTHHHHSSSCPTHINQLTSIFSGSFWRLTKPLMSTL